MASIHALAIEHNWLDARAPIPDDATLAVFRKPPPTTPQCVSSVEAFRDEILAWHALGINATTIRRALQQQHGYNGSVHALYRFLNREVCKTPEATINSQLSIHIKKHGKKAKFSRVGPGVFSLNGAPSSAPESSPPAETPAAATSVGQVSFTDAAEQVLTRKF